MSSRFGLRYTALLASLPLAAFMSGPVASSLAPDLPRLVLLSVLPTFLPLLALGAVAVLAYRRARSLRTALLVTTFAFLVGIVGATAYLIAVWPTGS